MPGTRDGDTEPVQDDHHQREEDLVPQIGDLEDVLQVRQHSVLPWAAWRVVVESAVGELVALDRRTALLERQRQQRDATACGRDGSLSSLRNSVGRDVDLRGDLAAGEDLDEGALGDEPVLVEQAGVDLVAGSTASSVSRLTRLVLDAERVVEALRLGTRCLSGIWPPSKPRATLSRALWPLVPRPAVLPPLPPMPRPTRAADLVDPGEGGGVGRHACQFSVTVMR